MAAGVFGMMENFCIPAEHLQEGMPLIKLHIRLARLRCAVQGPNRAAAGLRIMFLAADAPSHAAVRSLIRIL